VLFVSSIQTPRQPEQRNKASDIEEARADVNSHEFSDDKVQKPTRRNRELERLGVVAPLQQANSSRRQSAINKSANKKSEVVSNYCAQTSQDDKSSTSATDVDEDPASETDVDHSSDEEIIDDDETEGTVSDTDNEVIIVSEVKGQKSSDNSLKTTEKFGSDRSDGPTANAASYIPLKKPRTAVGTDESSSRWMHRVKMLETTMADMKAKFAEVLRVKVSDVHYSTAY